MASQTPAIERLQKRLEKEPNSLVFVQLADEYRKEGMLPEALKVCREGLRKHPNYWSALAALGRIQYEMGDPTPASETLEKVIRAVPDHPFANRLLGDIYVKLGRPAEALKRYQMVQMLTPGDQDAASQIQKLERQLNPAPEVPQEMPRARHRESEPVTFSELQPEPMGELEKTQTDFAPEPQENFEKTQPDFVPPEFSTQVEPEETMRVEPEDYSVGDTFRLEEHAINTDIDLQLQQQETQEETQEEALPEIPLPEIAQAEIPEFLPEAEAPGIIEPPQEETVPQEASVSEEFQESDDFMVESVAKDFQSNFTFAEPVSPSVESKTNDADQLAEMASIFLEDQNDEPSLEVQSLDVSDDSEVDLTYEDGDTDDLEQVLEEASNAVHRDSTQPFADQDDTEVDADELTTETLAELYVQQGSPERAIKVYQQLLLNDPGNTRIQQRLAELNPVDALIASASGQDMHRNGAEESAADLAEEPKQQVAAPPKTIEERNEERQRKINTLESWLTSIRRER